MRELGVQKTRSTKDRCRETSTISDDLLAVVPLFSYCRRKLVLTVLTNIPCNSSFIISYTCSRVGCLYWCDMWCLFESFTSPISAHTAPADILPILWLSLRPPSLCPLLGFENLEIDLALSRKTCTGTKTHPCLLRNSGVPPSQELPFLAAEKSARSFPA